MRNKLVHKFVIGTFVSLYLLVSVISTIHVVDFFRLSNPYWLSVSLAIAFELGAAASLASLIILEKMNKTLVWILFSAITLMQMQGNMYYAFVNMENFQGWSELFGLIEEDVIYQKRVLAGVSGAILPLVALGFIKSLVDYIKPESEAIDSHVSEKEKTESNQGQIVSSSEIEQSLEPKENAPLEEKISSSNKEEDNQDLTSEEDLSIQKENKSEIVSGYYGDIPLDNREKIHPLGETDIPPVNYNKKGFADNSGRVFVDPMKL